MPPRSGPGSTLFPVSFLRPGGEETHNSLTAGCTLPICSPFHVPFTSAIERTFYNTGSRPLPAALHTSTQSTLLDDPPDVGTFAFAFTFSFHTVSPCSAAGSGRQSWPVASCTARLTPLSGSRNTLLLQYSPERAKPLARLYRAGCRRLCTGNLFPSPKPWSVMRLADQGRGGFNRRRAGNEDRTRISNMGGWRSTIEPYPRNRPHLTSHIFAS